MIQVFLLQQKLRSLGLESGLAYQLYPRNILQTKQYYVKKMKIPIKTKLTGSSGTIAYLSIGDTQVFPTQETA